MADRFVPIGEIVVDYDKLYTPEVVMIDGEPFGLHAASDHVPEFVQLEDDGSGYLTLGILADKVTIKGESPFV